LIARCIDWLRQQGNAHKGGECHRGDHNGFHADILHFGLTFQPVHRVRGSENAPSPRTKFDQLRPIPGMQK
jgi:hypothetical protein